MTDKKCYFCNDGDKFIGDTWSAIDKQLEKPVDLNGESICQLCAETLCKKSIDKALSPLGGFKFHE